MITASRAFMAQGVIVALAFAYFASYRLDTQLFDPREGGPLVVVDRNGEVLRRVPSKDGRPGRSHWTALSDVDSHAPLTLMASEDQAFFEHHGVDYVALARGLWLTLTTPGRYGGSTLTMQLARLVHSQGKKRTLWVKLQEIRAAWGIERNLSKQEILEQYLNRAYYGRGAYGIEAAAQRYFGKSAQALSAGEATYLAVLPRGPSYYDPLRHPERVLQRRAHLFRLLVRQGRMTQGEADRAATQTIQLSLHSFPFRAPHAVDWILRELPEEVRAKGGTVHTTLDVELQEALEHRTAQHVAERRHLDVRQAGAVILDAQSGDVLAMVGSREYADLDSGHLNIITRRRFPGSSLKPFVYGTAIEAGHSPASIAFDVRGISKRYSDTAAREHGPVPYREALAGSYNFAAVHVIEQIGVPAVMRTLRAAKIGPLEQRPDAYGSRLALGSTKVRLLDLTAGYRAFVHAGQVVPPRGVQRVEFPERSAHTGREPSAWQPPSAAPSKVFSEETAWLVMDMLSDPEARRPMFGDELPVDLPYRVVAKTGTAEGFADTVAVLATEQWLVGAWAGRFDGRATQGQAGMAAAAPLARAALLLVGEGQPLTLPARPSELTRASVCPLSGQKPGPSCPHEKSEWFRNGTEPSETCENHSAHGRVEYPPAVRRWARRRGLLARHWSRDQN